MSTIFIFNFLRNLFGKIVIAGLFSGVLVIISAAQAPNFRGRLINQAGFQVATVEVFGTNIANTWSRVWMQTGALRIIHQAQSYSNGFYYSRYVEYRYFPGEPLNFRYWSEIGGGWMAVNMRGDGYMTADYQVAAYMRRVPFREPWTYYRLTN